jgi:hypothetical protein
MNAAIYQSSAQSGGIIAHNFPLPNTLREEVFLSGTLSFFISLGIVIGFAFVSAFYASFIVYERENNVKHQQVSALLCLLVPGILCCASVSVVGLAPSCGVVDLCCART